MIRKKSKNPVASAVSLALSSMMLSASLSAGVIDNSNPTPGGFPGACGFPESAAQACVGAWSLGNVTVKQFHADGTEFGTGVAADGTYATMVAGDTFASMVNDWDNPSATVARVSGAVWPVGEPTGIKAVYGDTKVTGGKPRNCLINTAYLDGLSDSDKLSALPSYLDSVKPEPVICSSDFRTPRRFDIAMLPATIAGVADGDDGKPIDLVFNVEDGGGVQRYQVFSRINNYTGKRLKGYKIQVGTGVGAAYDAVTNPGGFRTAAAQALEGRLFISLGIGEGADQNDVADGTNLFGADEGLATFSHALFGAPDTNFTTNGFFDFRMAGFGVEQTCSVTGACPNYQPYPADPTIIVRYSDTIESTTALPSNYVEDPVNFGDWLHSGVAPKGIFRDVDNDPTTDADLVAYWNGRTWVKGYDSRFAVVTEAELNAWAADPAYSVDVIRDTVNLGINYIVNVGDDIDGDGDPATDSKVTLRIIPVVGDQTAPVPWLASSPATGDLLPVADTASGGGGCAVGGNGRFDPTLPALLAAGLGFFGWRRFKAGK